MVRSENDPATKHEATIDDQSTEEKTKNERQGFCHRHEEQLGQETDMSLDEENKYKRMTYIVFLEEGEIA